MRAAVPLRRRSPTADLAMTTSTTDGVSTESPALPDAFERDLPWLVLSGGAAVVVYVAYLATHPYPAFGAGLFFRAAEEVAAAGYGLPTRIDGYTADGVPFAYPPLPFYVLAVALEAGLDPVAVSRYLPGLLVVAALAPYYYAAKGLLGSVPKAGLATVLLAVAPTVLRWHLSAGGVVRALAFALVAIGLYAGVRLFRMEPRPARWLSRTRWRWLALATTAFGLTVLSHPIYAVFFGVSYLVLFWFGDRSPGGLARGAIVAVGGLALAAPWWLPVISVHGVEVFAGAAGTHGGLGGRPHRIGAAFLAPLVPDAETPFFLAAYAGAAYLLYRREYRLPAWLLVAGYVVGKGRFLFVPGAMTAAVLVFDWLLPRVAGARAATPSGRLPNPAASLVLALVVLVATGVGGLAAAGQLSIWHGGPSQPAFVDDHDRAAMAWASEHTGPDATYVVLGDAAEWFPLLADRPILVGHWGTEWEGAGEYRRQLARYRTVSACDTERCVTAELDGAGLRPDYVYVPKGRYSIRGEVRRAPPGLVETMADAGRYELVYGNGGVAVFRLTPRSDRDGHAPRTPLKSNGTERNETPRIVERSETRRNVLGRLWARATYVPGVTP